MSLRYEFTEIKDWFDVVWIEVSEQEMLASHWPTTEKDGKFYVQNPVTTALIFKMPGIGIGEITKTNAAEFYSRCRILETLDGESLIGMKDRPDHIIPQDVIDHIGLSTNVSYETFAKWIKRTMDRTSQDFRREFDLVKNKPSIKAEPYGLAFDAASHPDHLYDESGKLKT